MGRSCNRSMRNGNESPKKKEKEKQTYCNTIVNYITVSTTRLYIHICTILERIFYYPHTYSHSFNECLRTTHIVFP